MKKTKLLIPALSVASVGAVVAPMVTSCAKENWVNLLTYEYTEEPREGEEDLTVNEAADLYYGNDRVVPLIIDDVYYHVSWYAQFAQALFQFEETKAVSKTLRQYIASYIVTNMKIFDFVGSFKEAKGSVNNLKVVYDKTTHKATMSADIKFSLVSKMVDRSKTATEGTLPVVEGTYTLDVSYSLKDVPYVMSYYEPEWGWLTYIDSDDALAKDDKWEIKRTYEGTTHPTTGTSEHKKEDATWNKTHPISGAESLNPKNFLSWNAYYLENNGFKTGR